MPRQASSLALALMVRFADRTGLTSGASAQRYLWTDAFAVCNFLGLARATGEVRYATLARDLVDQVHRVLGRWRGEDRRTGWISGLSEEEGARHPTRGGLRIGKRLPERGPGERFDEEREWDRDGQYFHYLTKWMHALDQMTRNTGDPRYHGWARELARSAHGAFAYAVPGSGGRRMHWKMSADLSRPLVPSMGQHDPLDGWITCLQLESTARELGDAALGPSVAREARDYAEMASGGSWVTADALGLGGLLSDAFRVVQLMDAGALEGEDLLVRLLEAARVGLHQHAKQAAWREPAAFRLAFRELGLAIGLRGIALMAAGARGWKPSSSSDPARLLVEELARFAPLGDDIDAFWSEPANRDNRTWMDHRDINDVMLATALAPEGFLVLRSPDRGRTA